MLTFVSLLLVQDSLAQQVPIRCETTAAGVAFLKCYAENQEMNLLIDSGASHNVICSSVVQLISDETPTSIIGSETVKSIKTLPIQSGQFRDNSDAPLLVMNLAQLSSTCRIQIHGILGIPFLADKAILIQDSVLYLAEGNLIPQPDETIVPCQSDSFGRLFVDLGEISSNLGGLDRVLIDTGMNEPLCLNRQDFAQLSQRRASILDTRTEDRLQVQVGSLTLTKVLSGHTLFRTLKEHSMTRVRTEVSSENKVGLPLLSDIHGRIDFKSKRLLFRTPVRFIAAQVDDSPMR